MLTRSEKEIIVGEIKADIEKSAAVFLTNLVGITANDAVKVRKDVRQSNGKIIITKNTLLERASVGTSCEKLFSKLKGPNAMAFAFEDAASVAKCIFEAGKKLETVQLKGGILAGKELSAAQVKELANLPSRDQMLAQLLATFNAPISSLVRVLDEIRRRKEQETGETVQSVAHEIATEEQ